MSLKRPALLFALLLALTVSSGGRANATYTITSSTAPPVAANLTFTFNPLNNAPLPTPATPGQQYSFMTIAVAPGALNVNNEVVTYDVVYNVLDNTTLATSSFEVKGAVTLNLTNGSGSLSNAYMAPFPTGFLLGFNSFSINPVPPLFAGPTLVNGSGGNGVASLNLTSTVVPEPTGFGLMGLGTAFAGLVFRRRLSAAA